MSKNFHIKKENNANKLSLFSWLNIEDKGMRVGKIRTSMDQNILIINSINIFPEYQRNGYARRAINNLKDDYEEIIADRVRDSAKIFWTKMTFIKQIDGNYIWRKI